MFSSCVRQLARLQVGAVHAVQWIACMCGGMPAPEAVLHIVVVRKGWVAAAHLHTAAPVWISKLGERAVSGLSTHTAPACRPSTLLCSMPGVLHSSPAAPLRLWPWHLARTRRDVI